MQNTLNRYRLGLSVLGIFSLVIVGIVVVQASATKADSNSYKAATKIADKLDDYLNTSYEIPESLADAHITDVPDTVTYQKLSDSQYKFCVTYKADSSGFDATQAVTDVTTGAISSSSSSSDDSTDASYLYLLSTHHKGENCQTVTPYSTYSPSYDNTDPCTGGSGSDSAYACFNN